MTQPTIPIVTLNGSGRELLMAKYINQIDAVRNAIQAMRDNGPHGRDYPEAGTWRKAAVEHLSRISRLTEVLAEITAIAEAIR